MEGGRQGGPPLPSAAGSSTLGSMTDTPDPIDASAPIPAEEPPAPEIQPAPARRRLFGPARIAIAIGGVLLLLYYPVGMIWISKVDDNPAFDPGPVDDGASYAAATAAALIAREVEQNGW